MTENIESELPELPEREIQIEECRSPSGFKVLRALNGIVTEIELTNQELRDAYSFKEHLFCIEDVALTLEELESYNQLFGKTADEIIEDDELMDLIASEYMRNINKYGMERHHAAVDAIKENLRKE